MSKEFGTRQHDSVSGSQTDDQTWDSGHNEHLPDDEQSDTAIGQDAEVAGLATLTINGQSVHVQAFEPDQSHLPQVIKGQLNVYNPATETYETVGQSFGFSVNAVGYNFEDNLLYGFASKNALGNDSHGNSVGIHDLVAVDAEGNVHKLGHANFEQHVSGSVYVGEFGPRVTYGCYAAAIATRCFVSMSMQIC